MRIIAVYNVPRLKKIMYHCMSCMSARKSTYADIYFRLMLMILLCHTENKERYDLYVTKIYVLFQKLSHDFGSFHNSVLRAPIFKTDELFDELSQARNVNDFTHVIDEHYFNWMDYFYDLLETLGEKRSIIEIFCVEKLHYVGITQQTIEEKIESLFHKNNEQFKHGISKDVHKYIKSEISDPQITNRTTTRVENVLYKHTLLENLFVILYRDFTKSWSNVVLTNYRTYGLRSYNPNSIQTLDYVTISAAKIPEQHR